MSESGLNAYPGRVQAGGPEDETPSGPPIKTQGMHGLTAYTFFLSFMMLFALLAAQT